MLARLLATAFAAALAPLVTPATLDSATSPASAVIMGPRLAPVAVAPLPVAPRLVAAVPDTGRPHAIEYSDWYGRRLTIHRWGSYVMLPLFAAQYALGEKLTKARDNRESVSGSTKNLHGLAAGGVVVDAGHMIKQSDDATAWSAAYLKL